MMVQRPVVLLLSACHKGNLGENCHPDGTCDSPKLYCNSIGDCSAVFAFKPFCDQCAANCGDGGVRECIAGDPSIWGEHPSRCTCKP